MNEQTRPLHPPTQITLRVEGRFPGFPPNVIRVEEKLGTFSLRRDETWMADGQFADVVADDVRANLANIRERIVGCLEERGDDDSLSVLARVWPEKWEDAEIGAVWLLGNAARFGHPFAQEWLDRLVHPDGEPKESV